MFFRRHPELPINPLSAFVHQLTEEECRRYSIDIKHNDAVFNIHNTEKEEALMFVEKLKAYRAEIEANKQTALNADYTAEIEAKVAEYKESVIATYAANKAAEIPKLDSDLECLDALIAREEAAKAEVSAETIPE